MIGKIILSPEFTRCFLFSDYSPIILRLFSDATKVLGDNLLKKTLVYSVINSEQIFHRNDLLCAHKSELITLNNLGSTFIKDISFCI